MAFINSRPHGTRNAIMIPTEGHRWQVGVACEPPGHMRATRGFGGRASDGCMLRSAHAA